MLIDESMNVVAAVKQHTTKDVYGGIMNAVDAVLEESGVDAALINQAMLGTTQCTNAIVERKGLSPIAILRIGAPATEGIPPMVDWEDSIRAVCVDWMIIGGGFEFNGKRLNEFDEEACRAFLNKVKGKIKAWPSPACSPPCATMTRCVRRKSPMRFLARISQYPFPAKSAPWV